MYTWLQDGRFPLFANTKIGVDLQATWFNGTINGSFIYLYNVQVYKEGRYFYLLVVAPR